MRKKIDEENKRDSRCSIEIRTLYHPCCFRARRPMAARQDAKHPVKIRKMAEEKGHTSLFCHSKLALMAFLLSHFPYFLCARKLWFTLRYFACSDSIIRNSQHPRSSRPERSQRRSGAERPGQIAATIYMTLRSLGFISLSLHCARDDVKKASVSVLVDIAYHYTKSFAKRVPPIFITIKSLPSSFCIQIPRLHSALASFRSG